MAFDYYLSSLQYQLMMLFSMMPNLVTESCSVPTHMLLYSIVISSVLISISGVWFYKRFIVSKAVK